MATIASLPPLATRSPSELSSAGDEEKALSLKGDAPAAKEHEIVSEVEGPFVKLTRYLKGVGVETRSLERVPEDQREHLPLWRLALRQIMFWFSVNLSFSCLATGYLGSLYYTLDYRTSLACIYLGVALGCCVSATMATIGPKTGLRTMAAARFAGGFPGSAFMSLLNAVVQICYAISTAIAGGQALRAVHGCSLAVGIAVLSVVVLVLSIYGYRFVHYWERYAWIGCFIIYCIVLGLGSRGDYDVTRLTETMDSGRALTGDVLSFFGIMFSVGSGWTSIAADYNITLPVETPSCVVWVSSFIGMYLPIVFTCTTSATFMALSKPDYVSAFEEDSLGGVVGHILTQNVGDFGRFLLVLLAFSTVSAQIPNVYSGALCIQAIHPVLLKIPRIFFVLLFTVIYFICAMVGREHLSEIVGNFAAILAYYTAFLASIVFIEIFWFRRENGPLAGKTNWDDVTDYKKLPPGIACCASIACTIPVIAMGMAATWWVGPIAKAITLPASEYGGDLGFELSAAVSMITYPLFRHAEIRYFGR
ncbi:hypothetical protein JCM10450v2_003428 [Rhodotorula kratochvilovae]